MIFRLVLIGILPLVCNCNNPDNALRHPAASQSVEADTSLESSFFPVTAFLKGEIYTIRNKGITPLKKITVGQRTDSSWVKIDSLEPAFAAFLDPTIDTANLKGIFSEKKFLDQTINSFTFTYDPANEKANDFAFKHWDVYVNPETNRVTRIYLVKKTGEGKVLQLTWQSGKWCKLVTINENNKDQPIEREEKISWSYD